MYVILDHGGETSTLYRHCSKILVAEDDSVVKGQKIAETGATGYASEPHLHFEVRIVGKHENPIPYINRLLMARKRRIHCGSAIDECECERRDERFPSSHAEIEYDDFDNAEAIDGAQFDDLNFQRYHEI